MRIPPPWHPVQRKIAARHAKFMRAVSPWRKPPPLTSAQASNTIESLTVLAEELPHTSIRRHAINILLKRRASQAQ